MKTYNTNYAIGKPYGNVDIFNEGTKMEYRKGTYTFYNGIVTFYAEEKYATFSFAFRGRNYGLSLSKLNKPLKDRKLIVRAGKLGRSVVKNYFISKYKNDGVHI